MVAGEPDFIKYAQFGRFVAATLGSSREWNGDTLQSFGDDGTRYLGMPVGSESEEDLAMWREVAREMGIDVEEDEEPEDEEPEDEADQSLVSDEEQK